MTFASFLRNLNRAVRSIISFALLLTVSGCGDSSLDVGDSSDFDVTSFKKSARFLKKSQNYRVFKAAKSTGNPLQLQKVRDEFATFTESLVGKEVQWTVTIQEIEEGRIFLGSNESDVFVGDAVVSGDLPDWKSTVVGLAVRQTVKITAKIRSIKLYASYDDMLDRAEQEAVNEAPSDRHSQIIARAMSKWGASIFASAAGLLHEPPTPFIAVKIDIADVKLK